MKKYVKLLIMVIVLLGLAIPSTIALLKRRNLPSASLSLATWSVSLVQEGVNNNLSITQGGSEATYNLNVKSTSEVDISYTIVIRNVPTGVEVSLDNGNFTAGTNGTITFTDAGSILYNAASDTNNHVLAFQATSSATPASNLTLNIDVIAKQII